jgi:hypothetical protein
MISSGAAGKATPDFGDVYSGPQYVGLSADAAASGQTVVIPRGNLSFGGKFAIFAIPGFSVSTNYCCHSEMVAGIGDGSASITLTARQLYKPADDTKGWITTGAVGTQNGTNRTFTLLPGYSTVRRVWQNGVERTDFIATDGSTVETRGWAPQRTDVVFWEYYIQ